MTTNDKILIGCDAIMNYIGISSRVLFKEFIENGMPAKLINNRWYAYTDNLDDFFKILTRYREKNPPEDAE